jgi:salicylate hydroxylase
MGTLPVLVAGGGIAGLSVAIALSRRGWPVLLAEKRTDAIEAGAGIQLSPNASRILIGWGLGPSLARNAVAPSALAIRRWEQPRAFQRMSMNGEPGAPFWVTLRADLHAALRAAAEADPLITLLDGRSFTGLATREASVHAIVEANGDRQTIEAAFLIGADGQRSIVRKLMGDARDLDAPGWEAWRTLIPAESVSDFARATETNLWLAKNAHAVHYPVAAGRLVNLVVIACSAERGEGWDRIGDPALLAPIMKLAAGPLRELAAASPQWSRWTLRDRAPSPFLAKELTVLVGDAAHPLLPFLAQGAAMAIEDAAVLAAMLPNADADASPFVLRQALQGYAASRARRIAMVHAGARANARNYHLAGPLAWLRDQRIVMLGSDGMRRRYSWLYDWRAPSPSG